MRKVDWSDVIGVAAVNFFNLDVLSAKQMKTGDCLTASVSEESLANFKQHELAPEQSAAAEHF